MSEAVRARIKAHHSYHTAWTPWHSLAEVSVALVVGIALFAAADRFAPVALAAAVGLACAFAALVGTRDHLVRSTAAHR